MPESNGLIQGLSSMESRACQIACNQQPSPLSDGGMVHVEGKQRINTEWSFCSGDVVPLHLTKPADETVFTVLHSPVRLSLHPIFLQFPPSNPFYPLDLPRSREDVIIHVCVFFIHIKTTWDFLFFLSIIVV